MTSSSSSTTSSSSTATISPTSPDSSYKSKLTAGKPTYQPCLKNQSKTTGTKTTEQAQKNLSKAPSPPPISDAKKITGNPVIMDYSESMKVATAICNQCIFPHTQNLSDKELKDIDKFSPQQLQEWIVQKMLDTPSRTLESIPKEFTDYQEALLKLQEAQKKIEELENKNEEFLIEYNKDVGDAVQSKTETQQKLIETQQELEKSKKEVKALEQMLTTQKAANTPSTSSTTPAVSIETPLSKAEALVIKVQELQTRSGTLIDNVNTKKVVANNLSPFPDQLNTLIEDVKKIQATIETAAEALKETIVDSTRAKVAPEDVETIARAIGQFAATIEADLERAKKTHDKQITTLGELTAHWLGTVQKLNTVANTLNEALNGAAEHKDSLLKIKINLQEVSKSITTLATICNPVTKIRQQLMTQVFDCELSVMTLTSTSMRLTRKAYMTMYERSEYPTEPALRKNFIDTLKETYEQQKSVFFALVDRGDCILPLLNKLIEDLQEKVNIGKENELIPLDTCKHSAVIRSKPLKDIEDEIRIFREEQENRKHELSLLIKKRDSYKEAADTAKKELNRTYDAITKNGYFRSETLFDRFGYVDLTVRTPFEPKPEPTPAAPATE